MRIKFQFFKFFFPILATPALALDLVSLNLKMKFNVQNSAESISAETSYSQESGASEALVAEFRESWQTFRLYSSARWNAQSGELQQEFVLKDASVVGAPEKLLSRLKLNTDCRELCTAKSNDDVLSIEFEAAIGQDSTEVQTPVDYRAVDLAVSIKDSLGNITEVSQFSNASFVGNETTVYAFGPGPKSEQINTKVKGALGRDVWVGVGAIGDEGYFYSVVQKSGVMAKVTYEKQFAAEAGKNPVTKSRALQIEAVTEDDPIVSYVPRHEDLVVKLNYKLEDDSIFGNIEGKGVTVLDKDNFNQIDSVGNYGKEIFEREATDGTKQTLYMLVSGSALARYGEISTRTLNFSLFAIERSPMGEIKRSHSYYFQSVSGQKTVFQRMSPKLSVEPTFQLVD